MRSPVVGLLVHHPAENRLQLFSVRSLTSARLSLSRNGDFRPLYLRSSQHSDGGDPIEAVAAHQVGNVVLDLHLLPRVPSTLKQLSSGCVVVLGKNRKAYMSIYCY